MARAIKPGKQGLLYEDPNAVGGSGGDPNDPYDTARILGGGADDITPYTGGTGKPYMPPVVETNIDPTTLPTTGGTGSSGFDPTKPYGGAPPGFKYVYQNGQYVLVNIAEEMQQHGTSGGSTSGGFSGGTLPGGPTLSIPWNTLTPVNYSPGNSSATYTPGTTNATYTPSGTLATVPKPTTTDLTAPSLTAPTAKGPYDATLEAAILKLLNTPQTVDPKSLAGSPENQAYRLAGQRSEERERAALAERAAAQGFSNSGGMETQLGGFRQKRAEGEASFLGAMAIEQMARNREDLARGLTMAQSAGQFDKAQQLQRDIANLDAQMKVQLANLDAALQREGYGVQTNIANLNAGLQREGYTVQTNLANLSAALEREGYNVQTTLANLDAQLRREGLSLQAALGQGDLDLRKLLGMANVDFQNRQLTQQNTQFGQTLGFNYADLDSSDRQWLAEFIARQRGY